MTTLELHFIGASSMEHDALMLLEDVDCSFIGLELPKPIGTNERLTLDRCEDCTTAARSRSVQMFKGAYHYFIKTDRNTKPDLAVALQTGYDILELLFRGFD
jgi:splicing suppressor protein 51